MIQSCTLYGKRMKMVSLDYVYIQISNCDFYNDKNQAYGYIQYILIVYATYQFSSWEESRCRCFDFFFFLSLRSFQDDDSFLRDRDSRYFDFSDAFWAFDQFIYQSSLIQPYSSISFISCLSADGILSGIDTNSFSFLSTGSSMQL